MSFLDKIKGLFKGKSKQVNQGVDKAADAVEAKTPDQYDDKVEQGAEVVKDQVNKLDDTP
jgi:MT0933-like antitoxin protein